MDKKEIGITGETKVDGKERRAREKVKGIGAPRQEMIGAGKEKADGRGKTKREKEVNRIDHKAAYTSFGELALVKTQKHKATLHRSASVYAADRSLLLEIGANDYLTMLQLIPSLKTHVEFLRNLHGDTMMRDEETPPSPEK